MLWIGFALLAFAAKGNCGTIDDSNHFMDTVLQTKMPSLVMAQTALFPFATIPDFSFYINKTGITNRKFKANVTEGRVLGLESEVNRVGNCGPPVLKSGNTSVTCKLEFNSINATFTADTRGDNIANTQKRIWVHVRTKDTEGTFEATALPGREPALHTFVVDDLELKVKTDSSLSLGDEREKTFKRIFKEKVTEKLYSLLYGPYRRLLELAVASTNFPTN